MSARNYKNNAPAATLLSAVGAADINLTVSDSAGFPATPFTATLERGTLAEEVVLVTGVVGGTFTVTRGYDGTVAQDHSATSKFEHVAAAIDYREANSHIQQTSAHGATGDIVGSSGAQQLRDKTLLDPVITGESADYAVRIDASSSGDIIDASTSGTPQFRVTRSGVTSTGSLNVTSSVNAAPGTTQGVTADKEGKVAIKAAPGAAGPELDITPPNATAGIATIKAGAGFQVDRDGKVKAKDVAATGNLTVAGDSAVTGKSSVAGAATVSGTLTVNGDTTVSKLQVAGNENVTGKLTVVGNIVGPTVVRTVVAHGAESLKSSPTNLIVELIPPWTVPGDCDGRVLRIQGSLYENSSNGTGYTGVFYLLKNGVNYKELHRVTRRVELSATEDLFNFSCRFAGKAGDVFTFSFQNFQGSGTVNAQVKDWGIEDLGSQAALNWVE